MRYSWAAALLAGGRLACAVSLDIDSSTSIKQASKIIATDLMAYYTGDHPGDTPGNLPSPYYWWEAGAMFGAMIDYWHYTGDSTWNNITTQALLHQVGPDNNYMPPNQSKTLGNDDQGFWGLAAMSAAESIFPDPPSDQPQWLSLAQAVFNTQARRWDTSTCLGGLRWQIFTFNTGYNYKNSISNGCFFNLATRLAMYTGNSTYADWGDKTWNWMVDIGLVDGSYYVYDGSDDLINCTEINHIQWSYNTGVLLLGAANMYNFTNGSAIWKNRTQSLLDATSIFFENKIMFERTCETADLCNVDQLSFKAYLSRWLAATTKMAPFTHDQIMGLLRPSAIAAAQQCSGGDTGRACGAKWIWNTTWDGSSGVGQQMAALEVIQSNLIDLVKGPATNATGGTSIGDNLAGGSGSGGETGFDWATVTTGDRVGAGIVTTLVLIWFLGGVVYMGI